MKNYIRQIVFPILVTTICVVNPFYEVFASQKKNVKYLLDNRIFKLSDESSVFLAQSNPIYGCWSLTFSSSGVVYESLLRMSGYEGVMVTVFYNPNVGRTDFVKQTMRLRSSAQGLLILGYNPVYAKTNVRHPTYSPDNFLFQVRPSGAHVFATCDNEGRCSPVEVGACPRS